MTASIHVVLQHREGRLHRMSREAVAAGQKLRAATGARLEAVLVGHQLDSLASEVCQLSLDGVRVVDHESLAEYTPGAYADALERVLDGVGPDLMVLPHTYQSVEFMARLAQRRDAALVPEVTSFAVVDGGLQWKRPILGGKLEATVGVDGDGLVIVSVQSGAFSADDLEAGAAEVTAVVADPAPTPDREILGTEEVAGEHVDLTQADAIVAVGRGIGGEDKLAPVQALAGLLGAELAASRPVIDNGWLPRDRQIGSSGQTVAPKLYVALGISGAIQHLVGMKGAKTVVVVNKDASAPIFGIADYGYVGDLHEFVPALTAALEEASD
jgi:electron transfer flavoprotein alpha subunit